MTEVIAVVASVVAIAGALGTGLVIVWKAWRKVDNFLLDWNGETRPGHPPIPPMPLRVSNLEFTVYQIQKEVTPNGGHSKSLGDRVARIEATLHNSHTTGDN